MLLERITKRLNEQRLLRAARAVLHTPPLIPRDDGLILYSMIGTRVLLPYLVAVKSLHAQLGWGRVVIVDDGTLTPADKAVLAAHLGNPTIVPLDGIDTHGCPRGGCWERLMALLDLRRSDYVIQLDSDTVTLGPVPEVADAIAAGRSFTLLGGAASELLTLDEIAARTRAGQQPGGRVHIQATIEGVMDAVRIEALPTPRYVRGCAGFAGFAPGSQGNALAIAFSNEAERLVQRSRWEEWGSEQVASNFVIANEPDPLMLPYDRYLNFWNEPLAPDAGFVHFVGSFRYHGGVYLDATRRAIAALSAR